MSVIEAVNLRYDYRRPPTNALQDVSFAIEKGTFTVIMGPNGSGKSTLLRLIMGLIDPTEGEVRLFGRTVSGDPEQRIHVGYVPQYGTINDTLPIRSREIVEMGISSREQGRIGPKEARTRAMDALEMMGLEDVSDRRYSALSGGQRQRVLIARALAVHPRLLVLDEPFSAMDMASQDSTAHFLSELVKEKDLTVVFVAHNLNPLVHFIDDILLINQTLVASGPPDEVLKSDILRKAFGASVPIFLCDEGYLHPLIDSAHG